MLHIRPEQMEALQQVILDNFIKRMVEHLNRVFPERCREIGEEDIDQLARLLHQRAMAYGISSERDVSAYVDVLFSLQREDDSGEDMQWARTILEDPQLGAAQKIEGLQNEAGQRAQNTPVVQ